MNDDSVHIRDLYVVRPSKVWDASVKDNGKVINQKVIFRNSPYLSLAFYEFHHYIDLFDVYSYRGSADRRVRYTDASKVNGVPTDIITRGQYVNVFANDVMPLQRFLYLSRLSPFYDFELEPKDVYSLEELREFYDDLRHVSLAQKRATKKYKFQRPVDNFKLIHGSAFKTTPIYAGSTDDHMRSFQKTIKLSRNKEGRLRK